MVDKAITQSIIIAIVALLGMLFIICLLLIAIKYCIKKVKKDTLKEYLYKRSTYYSGDERNNTIKEKLGLKDYANLQYQSILSEIRDSAYVYLQFFLRSNSSKNYELVEHLQLIGIMILSKILLHTRDTCF